MDKVVEKYYDGFEGEGEIQFIHDLGNGNREIIRIWDGYFSNIMDKIESEEGNWTGIAYYYNLAEGWYDESPWLIPEIEKVLNQFERIKSTRLEQREQELLNDICYMLSDAISKNEAVWIADE